MAEYKVVNTEKLDNDLKSVANSIRAKGGTTANLTFPEGFNSAIRSIPQKGGSGIIDVTELPTSGIDENAVYRLTESIQTEKTEVYLKVYLNGTSVTLTSQQYLASIGVSTIPNIYVVDALSNMLETDVQTFSAVNIYILRSDGIAYAYVPAYGGIITMGLFGFQAMGYDKGFTEDINAETDFGVYTTIENIEEVVRYFIRENVEWKEVTAYYKIGTPHGFTRTNLLSGDNTDKVFSVADIMSGEATELDKKWFVKRNGEPVTGIRPWFFAECNFTSVTIPKSIYHLGNDVFYGCENLQTVTFEGKSMAQFDNVFRNCPNLTTINVPWSEETYGGAPWGATNATINYNYTEG